jgi:hypothetical protein
VLFKNAKKVFELKLKLFHPKGEKNKTPTPEKHLIHIT